MIGIAVSILFLTVWAICLALTIRFVLIVVAAGVMQSWESWTGRST